MLRTMLHAGLAAALVAPLPAQAQAAAQPSQIELEAALLAYQVRILSQLTCRPARRGCIKPPKRIKVRNYECQASGIDPEGGPILYCRVTYMHSGGSMAHVLSKDECVPLRQRPEDPIDGPPPIAWEVALVDAEGRCPGGRV
ncbi:MAG TPA: hypothetical protein VK472_06040 [Allosphingosinicella sp.]|nr:hypothetical protein [Allosphingosinicella sp.]